MHFLQENFVLWSKITTLSTLLLPGVHFELIVISGDYFKLMFSNVFDEISFTSQDARHRHQHTQNEIAETKHMHTLIYFYS